MKQHFLYKDINRLPSPTWNWLKMNVAKVEIESDSEAKIEKSEIVSEKKGEIVHVPLFFDEGRYEHEQTIIAKENAEITVIFDYVSDKNAWGFSFVKTRLVAFPHSKIHLVKVQLLGEQFVQIDQTMSECADNAEIEVTQIELGGKQVFAEVKTELNGFSSKFKSNTAYKTENGQTLDMNYVVNHHGQKTSTKMTVKGVVGENALKIYRGTIDFKRGCAGATGDEQEETLLLSESAVCKSIPVILCDEEDVSGTHGATLGRLGADELFYMQSRGISESEAKKMMKKAKIISVANGIPSDEVREKIESFLETEQNESKV